MTITATRSAYPTSVDALIPHARDLAADLGELPSRNKLMKTFRVGAPKANALIEALTAAPISPAPAPPDPAEPEPIAPAAPIEVEAPAAPIEVEAPAEPMPPAATVQLAAPILAAEVAEPPTRPADAEAAAPVAAVVRRPVTWPVLILCLPAFVAIWGGWVEMGRLTGFGRVTLLPGIADNFQLNTAITLPIGVETYAAYALFVWLSGRATGDARAFAKYSALASLGLGGLGQIAYHLMNAAGWASAPWPITAVVACIPVAVLGMGAALAHLMHQQP
jgi:hypothetical protein